MEEQSKVAEEIIPAESSETSGSTPQVDLVDENENANEKNHSPPTKRFATLMNLLNSLLGAGIISVPASFASAGVILSSGILIFVAALSLIVTFMLVRLQHETGAKGFDELCIFIGGKVCSIGLSVLSIIFLYCALLAYLIISGDMLISWFAIAKIDLSSLWLRALLILVYSIILPVALTIPRSLKFLSYFSTATVFFIVFYVIAMVAKGTIKFINDGIADSVVLAKVDLTIFSAFAVYVSTFSLPNVALSILYPYSPDIKKRNSVLSVTTVITTAIVILPSILGYIMFGEKADGNILNSFDDDDVLMIIVRIGFFFITTFSYPLVAQIIMCSFSQLFFRENVPQTLSNKKWALCQLPTHAVPVIIAMFMPKIKPVLAVGGSLGGVVVNFLYPAILWYLHFRPSARSAQFWGVIALGVFGAAGAVIATYQSILDVIASFK